MLKSSPVVDTVGFALSRVVVPLWILTGATVKLLAGSPTNLPQNFVDFGRSNQINLDFMLYTLIGLEFFAIGVMVLLARFARPMAIFMLSVFCLVLIGEMARGEESCGCFGGGVEVSPWQMLTIDALLLLGVILFAPKISEKAMALPKAAVVAAGLLVAGLGISFGAAAMLHQEKVQEREIVGDGDEADPTINPSPRSLPSWWYAADIDTWRGKHWREIELFQFMTRWPADMDEGTTYIVFYSRNCGHCRDMFEQDLMQPLDAPVVAIQIPASTTQLTGPNPLFDPRDAGEHIQHLALPLRTDWNMIQAPLAMRIEDGIVTCAMEGDHKECFRLAR